MRARTRRFWLAKKLASLREDTIQTVMIIKLIAAFFLLCFKHLAS